MSRDGESSVGLKSKTSNTGYLRILVILGLVVLTVTPILYMKKYMMVLWMLFLIFSFSYFRDADKKIRQVGLLGVTFVIICVLYYLFGISSADLAYCIVEPFVYFSPVIALFVIDYNDNERQNRLLFHFISLAIAVNIFDSIRISHELGLLNLAYQQLSGVLEDEGITGLNLGGTLFVNMVVFYANVMFISFMKTPKVAEKILYLLYLCISTYFIVFCSMKASAIILLVFSLILQFLHKKTTLW